MSGLWTPSGEHVPEPDPSGPSGPPGAAGPGDARSPDAAELGEEELAEELRRVRQELAGTPVVDIIANHAVGLWQLAVLHLTDDSGTEPRLDEAALAIDAMAAIVEGLGGRLGTHAEPLQDALAQLRLAFVQVRDRSGPGTDTTPDPGTGTAE